MRDLLFLAAHVGAKCLFWAALAALVLAVRSCS